MMYFGASGGVKFNCDCGKQERRLKGCSDNRSDRIATDTGPTTLKLKVKFGGAGGNRTHV